VSSGVGVGVALGSGVRVCVAVGGGVSVGVAVDCSGSVATGTCFIGVVWVTALHAADASNTNDTSNDLLIVESVR